MLELLLKQMGIDPKNIQAQIQGAAENFSKTITHFNNRMNDIEHLIRGIKNGCACDFCSKDIQPIKGVTDERQGTDRAA